MKFFQILIVLFAFVMPSKCNLDLNVAKFKNHGDVGDKCKHDEDVCL